MSGSRIHVYLYYSQFTTPKAPATCSTISNLQSSGILGYWTRRYFATIDDYDNNNPPARTSATNSTNNHLDRARYRSSSSKEKPEAMLPAWQRKSSSRRSV